MAVNVVRGRLDDEDVELDGDAGLNFWLETTDEPDTGKLEGLLTSVLVTEELACTRGCVTAVLIELEGIVTAELRTKVGMPRKGEAGEIFALPSVGESMDSDVVPVLMGDEHVVGVDGDDSELKNAALAALF